MLAFQKGHQKQGELHVPWDFDGSLLQHVGHKAAHHSNTGSALVLHQRDVDEATMAEPSATVSVRTQQSAPDHRGQRIMTGFVFVAQDKTVVTEKSGLASGLPDHTQTSA